MVSGDIQKEGDKINYGTKHFAKITKFDVIFFPILKQFLGFHNYNTTVALKVKFKKTKSVHPDFCVVESKFNGLRTGFSNRTGVFLAQKVRL